MKKKRQHKQKTRKQKQKGGFYPSVMGGIGNAAYLSFPAVRIAYRMFKSKKTRKHRK